MYFKYVDQTSRHEAKKAIVIGFSLHSETTQYPLMVSVMRETVTLFQHDHWGTKNYDLKDIGLCWLQAIQ